MKAPFTNQFIIAFILLILAIPLSMMGLIILALPMGLIGGFLLIREMYNKISQ
jgi:hypothetical protein